MSRVAVVSGSNKGIGFAIVKKLCAEFNGVVFLTSRDVERGHAAVKELQKLGLNPLYHQLDIDDVNSIVALRDFLKREYGGFDVLVNNAAMAYPMASTVPFEEQAKNTIKTNYYSTLTACRTLFPILKENARVVNVSSSMGMLSRVPSPELRSKFSSPSLTEDEIDALLQQYLALVNEGKHIEQGWPPTVYETSKVALTALTRVQQRDARDNILINAVHPGYVDTDMTNHKGHLTPDQGADAPAYCAMIPTDATEPRGAMIWCDRKIVDWIND